MLIIIYLTNAYSGTTNSEISKVQAQKIAENFAIEIGNCSKTISNSFILWGSDRNIPLAYVICFQPQGFVVVGANTNLPPVVAYSFENNFGENNTNNPLYQFVMNDLELKLRYNDYIPEKILNKWNSKREKLCAEKFIVEDDIIDQWPIQSTTTTGGWLPKQWNQTAPYNALCPLDGVSGTRSVAGCPSVAMALILSYHRKINGTRFSDADDYFHNFGAGRQYNIDDDFETYDFPSFPELNLYLDELEQRLTNNETLTNTDKAALTFACGVAATQVYSAEGSGTFGINQADDAYEKFNYSGRELLTQDDDATQQRIIRNMKIGLPAHYATVNEANNSGHNLVVDGYRTDDFFHMNFGFGGSYNAWMLIPEDMPFELTVLEGVIVDLAYPENAPPVAHIIAKTINEDTQLEFSLDDFTVAYEDFENENLAYIVIKTLPDDGILYIENEEVTTDQIITLEQIPQLIFMPAENFNGNVNFRYSVSDGNNLAACPSEIKIEIIAVNDPPSFAISGNIVAEQDFASTEILTLTMNNIPADEIQQVVQFSLLPETIDLVNMQIVDNEIHITSIAGQYGTAEVSVIATEVSESENNTFQQSFNITVNQGSTGISTTEEINFEIFPNPASDKVIIKIDPETKPIDLQIVDIAGKLIVYQELTDCKHIEIDVTNFNDGVYFVKLKSINSVIINKLIIRK